MPDLEALINRYRPNSWDEIVGHDVLIKALRTIVAEASARSFLLTGPSGCGKTTVARLMATEFDCRNPIEIDAATNNSVDDIRVIVERLKYKPILEDDIQVFILDECHMLSKSAWASLLKSIEEPPSWVRWFLLTTDAGRVPDNIKTRCVTAQFKPVSQDDLFDLLAKICDLEKYDTSNEVINVCVKEADGSPRQAIANLALCFNTSGPTFAADLLRSAAASTEAIDIIRALLAGADWVKLRPLLQRLSDIDPESVRLAIRAYLTKVILNAEGPDQAMKVFRILDIFNEPCVYQDGKTPLVLAIGRLLFTE